MNKKMLLGLTGLYCAGKNFVGEILEKKGFSVLDVDKLGHTALENQKNIVVEHFGCGVLNIDGTVNRRVLGEYVFGRPDKLATLEKIIHPEVNDLTITWIGVHENRPCVINAALLHKSCVFTRLDAIVFVKAPYMSRMFRAIKRDRLSWDEVRRRFASQQFDIYYSSQKTDIYYINNGGLSFFLQINRRSLEKQVDEILTDLHG